MATSKPPGPDGRRPTRPPRAHIRSALPATLSIGHEDDGSIEFLTRPQDALVAHVVEGLANYGGGPLEIAVNGRALATLEDHGRTPPTLIDTGLAPAANPPTPDYDPPPDSGPGAAE